MHILKNTLQPNLNGKPLDKTYRAVLETGKLGAIIRIEQPIKVEQGAKTSEEWHPTGGSWYLSTLLDGGIEDGLWIDYGQRWGVYGMEAVLIEAAKFLAKRYTKLKAVA